MKDLSINETAKLDILFCSICHAPVEYCDYSSAPAECKSWLAANYPDEYKNLYGDIPEGTLEQPAGEAPVKKGKPAKSSKPAKVVITVIERTKRKRITQIRGLDRFSKFY